MSPSPSAHASRMGSAKRTAVLFALAWCLLFSLHSRVTSGLYPGAIQIGWKALLALALSPLLLRLLGDYALRGPVLAGARPLALQRRGAQAQRRGPNCLCHFSSFSGWHLSRRAAPCSS